MLFWDKRNKLGIHATMSANIKYISLTERRQTQKSTYCRIPFMRYSEKGKNYKDRKQVRECSSWGKEEQLTTRDHAGNILGLKNCSV